VNCAAPPFNGSIALATAMEANMATEARIRQLDERHHALDERIEEALKHPSSDTLQVAALKKQKLKIKEEIEQLRQRQSA